MAISQSVPPTGGIFFKHFRTLRDANRQAGVDPCGPKYTISTDALLLDWAAVARKLGKLPTSGECRDGSRYDFGNFQGRKGRWKRWGHVALAFRQFAKERLAISAQWADVLAMIAAHLDHPTALARLCQSTPPSAALGERPRKRSQISKGTLYGPPLLLPGLANGPIDETGVIFLFGVVAHRLGFTVLRTRAAFPDCEALREVQPGCWQRVTIEFEFESRNFLIHKHAASECDMIVCWRHNWPECPAKLEVIELARVVKALGVAESTWPRARS